MRREQEHIFAALDKVEPRWVAENAILVTVSGSRAYGLETETSDYDAAGITLAPREYFMGFLHRFDQAQGKTDVAEVTIYDLRRFCVLAADCNPNVVELLYTDDADVLRITDAGRTLRAHRHLFLSTKAEHTFSGYAMSQLKRIRTHRRWLLNPPDHKPTRAEYGLPETTLLTRDVMGAIETLLERDVSDPPADADTPPHVIALYQQERAYRNAQREWQQHENWRANRNPKRAALEAAHGYDRKHAMHLMRLLTSGLELLKTGTLTVRRPDAAWLRSIRAGALGYDELLAHAERLEAEIHAAAATSPLPHHPNRKRLDELCRELIERAVFARAA